MIKEEDKKIEENECIDSLEKEEDLQEVDNAEEVNSEKVEDVETNFDDLLNGVKEENQKLLDENNKIKNEYLYHHSQELEGR